MSLHSLKGIQRSYLERFKTRYQGLYFWQSSSHRSIQWNRLRGKYRI